MFGLVFSILSQPYLAHLCGYFQTYLGPIQNGEFTKIAIDSLWLYFKKSYPGSLSLCLFSVSYPLFEKLDDGTKHYLCTFIENDLSNMTTKEVDNIAKSIDFLSFPWYKLSKEMFTFIFSKIAKDRLIHLCGVFRVNLESVPEKFDASVSDLVEALRLDFEASRGRKS